MKFADLIGTVSAALRALKRSEQRISAEKELAMGSFHAAIQQIEY